MSRHYSGGRLVAIECDACGALIAPNPDIATSGWVKCGTLRPSGDHDSWDYCPRHADKAEQFAKEDACRT